MFCSSSSVLQVYIDLISLYRDFIVRVLTCVGFGQGADGSRIVDDGIFMRYPIEKITRNRFRFKYRVRTSKLLPQSSKGPSVYFQIGR